MHVRTYVRAYLRTYVRTKVLERHFDNGVAWNAHFADLLVSNVVERFGWVRRSCQVGRLGGRRGGGGWEYGGRVRGAKVPTRRAGRDAVRTAAALERESSETTPKASENSLGISETALSCSTLVLKRPTLASSAPRAVQATPSPERLARRRDPSRTADHAHARQRADVAPRRHAPLGCSPSSSPPKVGVGWG